jgi:uncharacterized protein (DUF1501 family)
MRSSALANLTRRELLRSGVIAAGAAGAASVLGVPGVMEKAVYAAGMENVRADVTVGLVHLAGGHDGLGTVIPLTDALEVVRPGMGDATMQGAMDTGTRLNADFALHPSLKALTRRFKEGHVAILMDVGYPMASRSHLVATQIWQTADPTNRQMTGAFGRLSPYLDANGRPFGLTGVGSTTAPGILRGQGAVATLPVAPAAFAFKGNAEQAVATLWKAGVPGTFGQALVDAMAAARATAARLRPVAAAYRAQGAYDGASQLARDLQTAAALVKGGAAPAVFNVTMGGWDLHQAQQARQADLLRQFDEAVDAFLTDCSAAGRSPTIVTWSEFGRSVPLNSSGGSDHGDSSPMLVVGQNVVGGIYGTKPRLSGYDVPMQLDFRSVYATLIDHLGVDPKAIVGDFAPLAFLGRKAAR